MSVCFYGTFRDEAKSLPQMLEAMEPFTDAYTFLEGGPSRDRTAKIIRDWLKTHDGVLVQHKRWQGIERAQNAAMRLAISTGADYTFTGAGGEVLRQVAPLPKLTADVYFVQTVVGDVSWQMPTLVRSTLEATWRMPTHSYLDLPYATATMATLPELERADISFDDRREGKLRRDRRLLERYLVTHPGHSRATFYLAQTYRDLGQVEKAVELYRARSWMPDHEEERWYAHLMYATLTGNTHELLVCWQARPKRSEPLMRLAAMYGESAPLVASLFEQVAGQLPEPEADFLFRHHTNRSHSS